jgi:hypothetical protein
MDCRVAGYSGVDMETLTLIFWIILGLAIVIGPFIIKHWLDEYYRKKYEEPPKKYTQWRDF